jgi:hypothetical protein
MTDRELLELAARAAGVELKWTESGKHYSGVEPFNPLTNDGDALRLAVKLNLLYGKVFTKRAADNHEDGDDIYAATRRAIVMAAAEIGKGMA